MNDQGIIIGLQNKDPNAFKELIDRYGKKLYRTCVLLGDNIEESKDLYQETLARAYANAGQLHDNSFLYAWLYRIMSNIKVDLLRKKYIAGRHFFKFFSPGYPSAENSVIENMDKNKSISKVRALFTTLSRPQREIIILRFYEDLKLKEIAARLDVNIETIKGRLYRALEKIKKMTINLR